MGDRYKGNAGVGGTDAARARRVRTRRARGPASAARHGDARDEKTERGGNTALGVTQRTDDFAFTACNQARPKYYIHPIRETATEPQGSGTASAWCVGARPT